MFGSFLKLKFNSELIKTKDSTNRFWSMTLWSNLVFYALFGFLSKIRANTSNKVFIFYRLSTSGNISKSRINSKKFSLVINLRELLYALYIEYILLWTSCNKSIKTGSYNEFQSIYVYFEII